MRPPSAIKPSISFGAPDGMDLLPPPPARSSPRPRLCCPSRSSHHASLTFLVGRPPQLLLGGHCRRLRGHPPLQVGQGRGRPPIERGSGHRRLPPGLRLQPARCGVRDGARRPRCRGGGRRQRQQRRRPHPAHRSRRRLSPGHRLPRGGVRREQP